MSACCAMKMEYTQVINIQASAADNPESRMFDSEIKALLAKKNITSD
jgi:hypothetical protein